MREPPPRGRHLLRVSADPIAEKRIGARVSVRWVEPGFAPVGAVAADVENWDYYDGAIVGVGVTDGRALTISGSGVMVAPGLILTATHVVEEHADALEAGTRVLYCVGIRTGGRADLWRLRTLRYPEDESDIAFLGVELCSEIADDDWQVSCLPLSTRTPQQGEGLTIVSFRFEDPGRTQDLGTIDGTPIVSRGRLFVATGITEAVWYPFRDRVMMPFPTIEIACGSLGGMSGGAVIDADGGVVGILSTGLSHADGQGPSSAAWIIHALMFSVTLPWPPGVYEPDSAILELPQDVIKIVGRDNVRPSGPNQIDYTVWS